MKPLFLPPNPVQHFYRGGDRIAALRGITLATDRQPEEWLGSTVPRFGDSAVGLAVTADGTLLRDLVAADPESWVGLSRGSEASDVGILVKLLDARQRLPVHVHPDRAFASDHLNCPYGKTEAWFVLDAEPGSAFYVGWKDDVDPGELDSRRESQDSDWMLAHLNRIEARKGMGILVPSGTPHAIDGGIFVAEVQEPTDYSILLEWSITTSTREESHLDLGFERAMSAVSTSALSDAELTNLVTSAGTSAAEPRVRSVLPEAADPYFRLQQAAGGGGSTTEVEGGFAVILVTDGNGTLAFEGDAVQLNRGDALVVPHAVGPWRVEGTASVLIARPGRGWPATLGSDGVR